MHTSLKFLCLLLLAFISCKTEPAPVPPVPASNEFIFPDPPQHSVPLANVPGTDDMVMYEVNLRAFSQAGNLQGVISRLDQIKDLGVNVIWLMPIHPIGTINSVNSPYSVQNYRTVNPEFGTLSDLRALTDGAHQRGMAVVLDWVANHTAWDNPWVSKYPAWYTQQNGQIIHPAGTNWQDVADLNFDQPEMRKAMINALKYWVLAANVDGYRCDAADMVPRDFWQQAIDSLRAIPGREVIWLAEGARADHFAAGFDLNFGWDFYGKLKGVFTGSHAANLYTSHQSEYNGAPAGKHRLRFTTNHDESAWDATPITLFNGKQGALAAQVVAAYLGGVPMIYGGQETGRQSTVPFFTKSPIDWAANPDMQQAYREMFTLYRSLPVLRNGTLEYFTHADVAAFRKTASNGEEVLVMVNVRNRTVEHLPAPFAQTTWTHAFSGESVTFGNTYSFAPYEYVVVKR